jgi:hypothetical protein
MEGLRTKIFARLCRGWSRAYLCLCVVSVGSHSAHAAQIGPFFPSHRFPTDESFHLGYRWGVLHSSSNLISTLTTDTLLDNSSLRVVRNSFIPEYQPNRNLSIGAVINLDSLTISDDNGNSEHKSGLGDQWVWGEFRFFDKPGASMGLAMVVKFPGYKNPTLDDVQDSSGNPIRNAYLGDAQTDLSVMGTSEYWTSNTWRARADLGFTYRTEQYSAEIPFLVSFGYVTPKVDIDFRVRGNLTFGNDSLAADAQQQSDLHETFENSLYALSGSPWVLALNPKVEVWLSTQWAASFDYLYSLMGQDSANFQSFGVGFTYRWAKTNLNRPRTFQQVDISTDQEAGQFQGEEQQQSHAPKTDYGTEIQEEPVPSGDEEFR